MKSLPALALSVLVACGGPGDPGPAAPAAGRDVVVVVIDTLRADRLPTYGYERDTAPFLAELATRGVVFDAAYGASTWTAPSTASLFTSLWPRDHGVLTGLYTFKTVEGLGFDVELNRIPPEAETLPEFFQGLGYRTYGFADNPNVDAPMGFDRGFDHFSTGLDRGSPVLRDEVLALRDELVDAERPYFLYLHLMDPHMPYEVHDAWVGEDPPGSLAELAYDSEIGRVDAVLEELFGALGLDRDAVVLVTSDHGEEFLDHGGEAHGPTLYDELLRVPLIVTGADEQGAPLFPAGRDGTPVCLIDLLPTLRGLMGEPPSPTDRGVDLSPLLLGTGTLPGRLLYPERPMEFVPEPFEVRGVIDGPLKLHVHSREGLSLFDLREDPGELRDLVEERAEASSRLQEALEAHLATPPTHARSFAPPFRVDPELQQGLGDLGYTDE